MVGQWVVTFLYLPYSGFKWLKNVDGFDVNSISETSPIGYILKVDLEYPNELHVLHNDYPLGLEKLAIPYATLSDCCKKNCRQVWNKNWWCNKISPKFRWQY